MSTIELRLKEDMEGPIIRMDKWYNDMDNEYNDYNESKHNTDIQTRAEVGKSALTTYC